MKTSLAKFVSRHRLRPFHIALCVLFVGWVPSALLAYYSYTVLSRTLEDKILADAQSLVRSLSLHVQNELERTGETMDYYRTLPVTVAVLQPPLPTPPFAAPPAPRRGSRTTVFPPTPQSAQPPAPAPPNPREWLASIFFPQKRLDGMFLTDAQGKLIASVPFGGGPGQREFTSAPWKSLAGQSDANYVVTPVYPRAADGRLVASVVVAVRDKANSIIGFLGADILVERIGKRLEAMKFVSGGDATVQILDQNGSPMLRPALGADARAGEPPAVDPAVIEQMRTHKSGTVENGTSLYIFEPIAPTSWTAVLEKSSTFAHKPVRDLLRQTLLLAAWLAVGTAVTAYVLSGFYRSQLQSSLRIEREKIFNEKILANMPVGIAMVDPIGEQFLQANSAFIEIAHSLGGLPRGGDITRTPFSEISIASREALARVLHFGVPFQAIEQRTPTASGQTRYLTINLLRLQDSQHRTLGVLCLVEDTTAAVALRQELINANAAKDQFLAQLSHELRNPLSPVITMVAELEALAEAQPAAREPLEIIRRNVELEARLIDDLLDVTRISSGKLQLSREVVDAHRTVLLAVEICQQEIDEKRLNLRLQLDASDHFVRADPARLQQILWNLIKNSVKFTSAGREITVRSANFGSGTAIPDASRTHVDFMRVERNSRKRPANGAAGIAREAAKGPVPASSAKAGQRLSVLDDATSAAMNGGVPPTRTGGATGRSLRIEIIDEGIGIEPQNLARIFNAFDQGQSSITRRFGGLGLGLAISKAMVEAHGGTLTATSEGVGRGATFTLELETCPHPTEVPADMLPAPAASGATTVPGAKPASTGAGRRILLVDDHEDTCLGMQRLLTRRGYQVMAAHTVQEALTLSTREPFDLLISDIGLPDGTGFDLMAELRSRGGPPGIALSGFGMENDVEKSRAAGFSEHLIKPVDIERLEASMRKLLDGKPAEG